MAIKFILESTDSEYREECTPQDSEENKPGFSKLYFPNILPGKEYSLIFQQDNYQPIEVYNSIPFAQLITEPGITSVIVVSFMKHLYPFTTRVVPDISNFETINGRSYFYILEALFREDKDKHAFLIWAYDYEAVQDQYPQSFDSDMAAESSYLLHQAREHSVDSDMKLTLREKLTDYEKNLVCQILYEKKHMLVDGYNGGDSFYYRFGAVEDGLSQEEMDLLELPSFTNLDTCKDRYIYFFNNHKEKFYLIIPERTYTPEQLAKRNSSAHDADLLIPLPANPKGQYYIHISPHELSEDQLNEIGAKMEKYGVRSSDFPYQPFRTPHSASFEDIQMEKLSVLPRDDDHYRVLLDDPMTYAESILEEINESEERLKKLEKEDDQNDAKKDENKEVRAIVVEILLGRINDVAKYLAYIDPSERKKVQQKLHTSLAMNAKFRILGLQTANLITHSSFTEALIDMASVGLEEESLELIASLQAVALASEEGLELCVREYEEAKDAAEKLSSSRGTNLKELQEEFINPAREDITRSPREFNWYTQFLLPLRTKLTNVAVKAIHSLAPIVQKVEKEGFEQTFIALLKKWNINSRVVTQTIGETGDLSTNNLPRYEFSGADLTEDVFKGLMQTINLGIALRNYREKKDLGTALRLSAVVADNVQYVRSLKQGSIYAPSKSFASSRILSPENYVMKNLGAFFHIAANLYYFDQRSSAYDYDAAMAHLGSAAFTIIAIAAEGPVAILAGFFATFCGIAASLFKDTPLEIWLKSCSIGAYQTADELAEIADNTEAPWAMDFEPWNNQEQIDAYYLIPYTPENMEIYCLYNHHTDKIGCIAVSFTLNTVSSDMRYSLQLTMTGGTTEGRIELNRDENLLMGYDEDSNTYKCYAFFHTDEWNDYYMKLPMKNDNRELFSKIEEVKQSFSISQNIIPPNYSELVDPEVLENITAEVFYSRTSDSSYEPVVKKVNKSEPVRSEDSRINMARLDAFYSLFAHYDLNLDVEKNASRSIGAFFRNIFSS